MAAATVLSALQWIGPLLIQEASMLYSVQDQVQNLKEELETVQLYLEDADIRQEDREIVALISQVRKLAHDAEDVIDTYILTVKARVKPIGVEEGFRKWISRHVCFLFNTRGIHGICTRIEEIQSKLKRVDKKFESCQVKKNSKGDLTLHLAERIRGLKPESFPHDDDDNNYVVGLEKDITTLVRVLMGEEMSHIKFVTMIGMGGSGKTTLARTLYNHKYIKDCFNRTAWVFISQEGSSQDILSQIYKKVGGSRDLLHASKGELVYELRHILTNKSYLIVLDDVWKREALEDILPALPRGDANIGSKIVITTRNREVTQFSIPEQNLYTYVPKPLSEEEAWELFGKIVLNNKPHFNIGNYGNLAKEMLKKCDGLPLAIVALCGILNTKNSISEWQQVSESVRRRVMDGTTTHVYGRVGDLLALSYDDLPYYLKPCFLYLGVFPEDCQIPAGMLIRMWIAEGLIPVLGGMSLEDVAMQWLEELTFRFLVQIVRTNFKGEIKAIRLHDLLRDLCVNKAKEQSFLAVYAPTNCLQSTDVPQFKPRRYALHGSVTFPTQVSNVRSITMLTRSSISYSAYASKETLDLHVVYMNFKLLRVLNLWGIKTLNGKLPTTIGSLFHLRYLGIRASNIIELPASIGNLGNLLILDYRNVDSNYTFLIKIPKTLGMLVQLRHLFLPIECPWSLEDLPLSAMKNLRTLWGVKGEGSNNWLSREVTDLSTTLKKLKIVVSTKTDLEKTFNCVSNINGLCTFHCEMTHNVSLERMEHPLSRHQQLHKLIVIGEIKVKLDLILPCNLVMLQLKNSIIKHEDPMEAIGRMQHLKHLRMSNSYQGRIFSCKRDSFPQLEELSLENFEKLMKWRIEEGSMLCLKKIHIFKCKQLSYPRGLSFVTTLQELEYHIMHTEFVQRACECGWSDIRLRLPYNFEAIIGKSDDLILDTSSINKIYEQLTVGIYLRKNTLGKLSDVYLIVPFPTQVSNLRSITMLTRSNLSHSACASKETLDLHIVYMNFKLLRLLNLWGIKTLNGKLPTTIGSLFHLRYLGIRTSNIIELPASIGNLGNLLVLDYRNVDSDNMFPIKIPKTLGKLVQLRHLFLPIESPWSLEALPLSAMKNLRTLWGIKGDGSDNWLSREVAHLSTTLKKMKIVVSTQTELEKTFNVVSNINALCTFHCEMRNNVSLQRMEHPLSTHQQLHKLIVVGEIKMKLDLILPCNLVMLELKNSIMNNEDPMEAIGTMQHLKLLRMSNSYQGRIFSCKHDSFPQLEELSLENFEKLKEWTIEEGSMLCLKKIHIFKCKQLSYPRGLSFVTTLQELEYHKVHEEFVQKARECGWSDIRLRLPYNYEAIIEESDDLIEDTSSIRKIYEQLTVGIFLQENTKKYWVTKQGDSYYNCFMLNGDTLLKGITEQREYWEKIRITKREASRFPTFPPRKMDSDLALLDVSKKELHEPSIREEYRFPVSFDARNLNLGITYKFAFVVMLPERFPLIDRKPLSANLIVFGEKRYYNPRDSMDMDADPDYSSVMIRMNDDSYRHEHKLHNKPRNEWIHLLAGRHEILDTTQILMFSLSGLMDEIVIKGVIIEPVFDTQTTYGWD